MDPPDWSTGSKACFGFESWGPICRTFEQHKIRFSDTYLFSTVDERLALTLSTCDCSQPSSRAVMFSAIFGHVTSVVLTSVVVSF